MNTTETKLGRYLDIISTVCYWLEVPTEEKVKDRFGSEIDVHDAATELLQKLGTGQAVYLRNQIARTNQDYAADGADLDRLKDWYLRIIETARSHGEEFVSLLSHFKADIITGLLIPPRSILESQGGGTKAESEVHQNIAFVTAQQTLNALVNHINKYIVNQLLLYNYGPKAINSVIIEAEPLASEKKTLLREIMRMMFAPQNSTLTLSLLDLERILEMLDLPKNLLIENALETLTVDDTESEQPPNFAGNEDSKPNEDLSDGQPRTRGNETI